MIIVVFIILISDYSNVHILDIDYHDLLQKPPEPTDAFEIFKDISSSWHEVGRCLGICLNYRDSLKGENSVDTKLERILNMWKQKETKDVTWRVILEVLEKLGRRDLKRKAINFLKTPETYKKYISKDDFFHNYVAIN